MNPGPKPRSFESFLRPAANGCIEWGGVTIKSNGKDGHRYGRFTRNGAKELAHRVAWERANGPIPDNLEVCHSCDNPLCCNPDHLFIGTHADNMLDAGRKGRLSHGNYPRAKGELAARVKLTDAQVRELRARRASGEAVVALAGDYGVHHSYISRLARGIRR